VKKPKPKRSAPRRKPDIKKPQAEVPSRTRVSEPFLPLARQSFSTWVFVSSLSLAFFGGLQTVVDYSGWFALLIRKWSVFWASAWGVVFSMFGEQSAAHQELTALAEPVFTFGIFILVLGFLSFGDELKHMEQRGERQKIANLTFRQYILSDANISRDYEGWATATIAITVFFVGQHVFVYNGAFTWGNLIYPKWLVATIGAMGLFGIIDLAIRTTLADTLHRFALGISIGLLYLVLISPSLRTAEKAGIAGMSDAAFMVVNLSIGWLWTKVWIACRFVRPIYLNKKLLLVWLCVGTIVLLSEVSTRGISLKALVD
jgi:hypothetical protein